MVTKTFIFWPVCYNFRLLNDMPDGFDSKNDKDFEFFAYFVQQKLLWIKKITVKHQNTFKKDFFFKKFYKPNCKPDSFETFAIVLKRTPRKSKYWLLKWEWAWWNISRRVDRSLFSMQISDIEEILIPLHNWFLTMNSGVKEFLSRGNWFWRGKGGCHFGSFLPNTVPKTFQRRTHVLSQKVLKLFII